MTSPPDAIALFPERLEFLFEPARYKVAYGGRGASKSWGFARALLIQGAAKQHRILCTREMQVSIRDSVHKLLKEQIDNLGLGSFYRVTQTQIVGANGTEFLFAGIRHNVDNIKSTEGITIAWVEEAQRVSAASWGILIPTIRTPGSEIWVSFNPENDSDPTYKRFITQPPPDAKVVKVGWEHNPWLPEVLKREKDYLYSVDPEAAAHVWGGETRKISDANVLRGRYRVEEFEPDADWNGPYYGADWGFSKDPTTLVLCWVSGRTLYVEHEAYGVGVDLDDTPGLFDEVPGAREHVIRADSSRPETISHLRGKGYRKIESVKKWSGSVEDGVEHLRSYKAIVIHPRCVHTADEARLWSYKTDSLTGDVLPVLVDKHDHCMDAIRYALGPLVQSRKSPIVRVDPDAGYTPRDNA